MTIIGQTFESLVNKTEDQVLQEGTLLARRAMQRQIMSGHDDALTQALRVQARINQMFDGFRTKPADAASKFDLNDLLQMLENKRQFERAREDCAALYKELFGEDIPTL